MQPRSSWPRCPRVVSLSRARAVTSRASGAASGGLAASWAGAADTVSVSARSDGTLAIRSIRRTLTPFPAPWSEPSGLSEPFGLSAPSALALLAAAGSASSAGAPGTAPTANTEGKVNTHRGIAVQSEDVRRDHAGLIAAGMGRSGAGHISGGPDPDPLTASSGHLAPRRGGQCHTRRDLETQRVQAKAAEPRAPARGEQQPVGVDPGAVF